MWQICYPNKVWLLSLELRDDINDGRLIIDQKAEQRFTVDVKKHAIEQIIPQLVALPVYFYKVALASL